MSKQPLSEIITSPESTRTREEIYRATINDAAQKGLDIIPTCCFSCNTACEVLVFRNKETGKIDKIEGDPSSPVTGGIACPKGLAAFDLLYNPDRLRTPLRRIKPRKKASYYYPTTGIVHESSRFSGWEEISWDTALDEIAAQIQFYEKHYGKRGIAFLEGTRRGWSRVYSRLANAFGAPNHGAAGWAQCLWPRLVDCKITFGAQYSEACDFRNTSCILVWGSNPAQTWPVQALEIMEARERGARLIVVDPRLSETAAKADLWLRIRPGTDTDLVLGIIAIIINEKLYDEAFVRDWTEGFDRLRDTVCWRTPEITAKLTSIDAASIITVARLFAKTKPACISRCVTVDQTADSFQLCRALSILAAITGNIDVPGGNVLCSSRGEISQNSHEFILANKIPPEILKDRRGIDEFPLLCGPLSPVPSAHMPTLWKTIQTQEPYPIKAALIFGSNAAVSYSNSHAVLEAMENLEFIAVCDLFMTPTAELADIVLPASSWLERENVISSFQTSNEYTVFQQRCTHIEDTRSDVEIISALAKRLGLSDYFWESPEELYTYLLSPTGLTFRQAIQKRRLHAPLTYYHYQKSGFKTPSGKVEIYSQTLEKLGISPIPRGTTPPFKQDRQKSELDQRLSEISEEKTASYPLILSTGARSIFFRHTENRRNPYLISQEPHPIAYIHPETARSASVQDGDFIVIETPYGWARFKARLDPSLDQRCVIAVPGWDGIGNINRALGWDTFAEGIGSVPMRGLRCRIRSSENA